MYIIAMLKILSFIENLFFNRADSREAPCADCDRLTEWSPMYGTRLYKCERCAALMDGESLDVRAHG